MQQNKGYADSFGPFLKAARNWDQKPNSGYNLQVIRLLSDVGAVPVSDLMKKSGLPFGEFAVELEKLQKGGLVIVAQAGEPTGEVVEITPLGRQALQQA
jgi:predicted transcriptional regulator